jgi:hypothetical protein
MDGDLFVSSNAKGADCVASLAWKKTPRLVDGQTGAMRHSAKYYAL